MADDVRFLFAISLYISYVDNIVVVIFPCFFLKRHIDNALIPRAAFTAVPNAPPPCRPFSVGPSLIASSTLPRMFGIPDPISEPCSSSEDDGVDDSSWEDYEAMASGG